MQTPNLPAPRLGTGDVQNTPDLQAVVNMAIDGLASQHSRRAYGRALADFMTWYAQSGQRTLSRATVSAHVKDLRAQGVTPASIAQRLAAISRMVTEAQANGMIPPDVARGILDIPRPKVRGQRAGNWLTLEQAQALIDAPDPTTAKGLRDRALFAVLIGCGLRRSEVVSLEAGPRGHIQKRDGRWAIVDLTGKGRRVRTIPIPAWAYKALAAWTDAAGITAGPVFRPVYKGGQVGPDAIDPQTVYDVLAEYRAAIDAPTLAAHDLRRTFAALCKEAGASTRDIQALMGHSSEATTERYLQNILDLQNPANDLIRLEV